MAIRSTYLKRQAGQSVIIAIAVLFILAFLAAIFVAVLARNLERTNRASDTLTADFYAQAGIQYANQMLTTSSLGADWRPPLQYKLSGANVTALNADETTAYNAAVTSLGLQAVPNDDPDSFWLNQGFTRYDTQGGRFLLRISYGSAPGGAAGSVFDNDNTASSTTANSKYIRIESIGRTGTVVANDPTTFTPQPIRLHAELVAYKPIGLVDYSRFITNKFDRADTANLGVPSTFDATTQDSIVTPGVYDFEAGGGTFTVPQFPLVSVYGNPAAGSGGSLRCNTNLRLYGFNAAFLDGQIGDDWEIAGNLTYDGFNAPAGTPSADNPTVLTVDGTDTTGAAVVAGAAAETPTPSNITSFGGAYNTVGGLIRDAGTTSDAKGFARSVQRLNPPSLDVVDPSSGLNRYQELTQTGTAALTAPASDPGPYAVETANKPATVFIDNISDVQQESSNVQSGGYTLRNDWLTAPGGAASPSSNWEGPFYNPPGATIVFGPIMVDVGAQNAPTQESFWGFTVTRTDQPVGLASGSPVTWQWKDANGNTVAQSTPAPTVEFAYGNVPANFLFDPANPVYFLGADNTEAGGGAYNSGGVDNNDIVIYAEGNVRVRGVVSPTSLVDPNNANTATDPSNGNKPANQFSPTQGNAGVPHHVTVVSGQIAYIEGSVLKGGLGYSPTTQSSSSIAILAESYVCINTTQFLAGASLRSDIAAEAADPASGTIEFDTNTLTEAFDLPGDGFTPSLYLSQTTPGSGDAAEGLVTFSQTTYDAAPTTNIGVSYDGVQLFNGLNDATAYLVGDAGLYNRSVLPLNLGAAFTPPQFAAPATGFAHLEFTFTRSPQSLATYQLQRAALLPSDIRIEAALYAQNNSFFVIPGPWFNSDSTDTIDKYLDNTFTRPHPDTNPTATTVFPGFTDERFPFFGQPIDMQITIDGSVVENMPADISDQTAWMLKWGWIPHYQGAELGPPAPVQPLQNTGHWPDATVWWMLGHLAGGDPALSGIPIAVQQNMPAVGLNITYDPVAGSAASGVNYDRLDLYGRPLPYTPCLPVSPDLLYSGVTPGNSLVQ